MAGIATIIMVWKQNVLELLGHYGSFSINSFIVKWYRQNLTILILFVPMLVPAKFSCHRVSHIGKRADFYVN